MTNPDGSTASDATLLLAFVESRSDQAFQELVEKHLGMLLGVALRQTGDHALAEEIVQNVFAILARKAHRLEAAPTLAGWLYRTTMIECAVALRKKRAHAERMKQINERAQAQAEGESVWRDALPLLDEVMNDLSPSDRDVILMRFWERKSFRQIGEATGKSEGASQKQAERALHMLSGFFKRRGATISITALAAGFPAHLASTSPESLAGSIAQGALAAAPQLSITTLILKSIEAMTYAKTKTAIAVAIVASVPLGMQWNANQRLEAKVTALESKLAEAQAEPLPNRTRSLAPVASSPGTATGSAQAPAAAIPADYLREWELALFERDPVKRSAAIARLLAGVTAENAPHVAAVFEQTQKAGGRFSQEYEAFMRVWGQLNGPAAVEYAAKAGGAGSPATVAAMAGWASVDTRAAQAWVEALPEGQAREDVIVGLLDGWSSTDHAGASRYAESRPRTPARNRMRQMLMEKVLLSGGIPAAQQWFTEMNGEGHNQPYKQLAFDELNERMLQNDPMAAAKWIRELDGEAYLGGRAIRNTATELAKISPTDALTWISSLNDLKDGQITSSLSQIVSQWATHDPKAAGAWLNENSGHTRYDAMALRYVLAIADTHPDIAMQWAQSISQRATAAEQHADRWRQSAGAAGRSRHPAVEGGRVYGCDDPAGAATEEVGAAKSDRAGE
ncbi:MAG: sigma-70 family RNA polymerase sigma factor [Verrucomicrobiales bacterium]|nr:sigma-70 family RNA polymerase sigma factor [Verrucomicrobiales bacterium]